MDVQYVQHWGDDLLVCNAARVSFDKKSDWEYTHVPIMSSIEHGSVGYVEKRLSAKDEKLIHYLAKHKHTSCFEHMGATLKLKVPIFIARQIQRHRTFSYNEISRRYVDSPPEFFWPDKWRKRADNVKQGSSDEEFAIFSVCQGIYPDSEVHARDYMEIGMELYTKLIDSGCAPEQARMILPQALYTEFYMTGKMLPR